MKKTLLFFCLITASISAFSQTIYNPYVERSDDGNCTIAKIETTKDFTIVSFEYIAPADNSWAQLNKEIFIKTDLSDKHYNYIKSENIPMAPEKQMLTNVGEKLAFKAYFQKIPATAKAIDIIENPEGNANGASYFNYYNVSLSKSQSRYLSATALAPPSLQGRTTNNYIVRGTPRNTARITFTPNSPGSTFYSYTMSDKETKDRALDAQLEYYQQPGKIAEIAKLHKEYFDALVKEGFTEDQALKIITSEGLLPKGK